MGLTQKLGTIPLAILTDASNNVGIGAAPSGTYKFEVTGTAKVGSTLLVSGVATIGGLTSTGVISLTPSTFSVGSASAADGNSLTIQAANSNYLLRFKNAAGTSIGGFYYDGTNSVADGSWKFNNDVTIGAPTTNATLNISGDNSGGDTYLNFRADNGGIKAQIQGTKYAGTGGQILFKTLQSSTLTEVMRINQDGKVGIGTNSPDSLLTVKNSSGGNILNVTSSAGNPQLQIGAPNATGSNANLYMECAGIFGAGFYTDRASQTFRGWCGTSTNGVQLSGGGTSWGSYSDERLKDIIEPITDSINKVNALRAVIGKYKTDEQDKRRVFLIAQDVEKVLPEAIFDDKSEEKILSLQYQDIIPLLVSAIQELSAQNQDLKSRLDKAGL